MQRDAERRALGQCVTTSSSASHAPVEQRAVRLRQDEVGVDGLDDVTVAGRGVGLQGVGGVGGGGAGVCLRQLRRDCAREGRLVERCRDCWVDLVRHSLHP